MMLLLHADLKDLRTTCNMLIGSFKSLSLLLNMWPYVYTFTFKLKVDQFFTVALRIIYQSGKLPVKQMISHL